MTRPKFRFPDFAAVAVLLPAFLLSGALAADEKPSARLEKLIPDDVIAYARFVGLTGRIESFLESGLKRKIVSSPLYGELLEDSELRRGLKRLREVEVATGVNFMKLLREVFRREVAIGLFLDFSGPQGVLLARFGDGEEARDVVRRLRNAAIDATGKKLKGTRSEYEGQTIETFESMAFAVVDDVLAVANQAGVLESVIDLASGRNTRSVFQSETYGPALEDGRPLFQLTLRPNFLPAVRLPEKLDALPSLLFGGWLGAIHASELLVFDLDLDKSRLLVRGASLVGSGDRARTFAEKFEPWFPRDDEGSLVKALSVDRKLATVEVHRDLAAWWADREDFVAAGARQQLDVFARYMSVVFGGASFEREVLSEIGSPITLVTRRQRYSGTTPEPALPGFAVIVPLRNPATFGQAVLAAAQRLVGIARVDQLRRGGVNGVELIQRTKDVRGRVLHLVEMKKRGGATAAGLIDNFSPCMAILDGHAVLSSTTELAERLIGDLEAVSSGSGTPSGARARAAPSSTDLLALDCSELGQALESNRAALERSREASSDDSEVGFRALELLLELFDGLRLSSARRGNLVRLSVELSVRGR